ncbi:hypothetical protein X748_04080 [Mesorhizobium sp. LNJC386A00]|nr:hypothetical protein X752_27825 [Mesorhizobium sp. LNJC398B00]ESY39136.1 hypothetical protein X748_04080 [Mesorhizobium sp. LNJC386A00]
MVVVKALIDHPVADWVSRKVYDWLSGRALSCAVNARNHLVRAQKIADISTTVSYFCATHATEEAVACFVASAKANGYRSWASKMNIRDHAQKVVVASYTQVIADHAEQIELAIAHSPAADDLLAKVRSGDKEVVYPLELRLFSFNEDGENPSPAAANDAFVSRFPDIRTMVEYVHKRANFRDTALYACDEGAPDLSREQLDIGLREHTFLTIGLIWSAIDVTYHKVPEPFVDQILGAISAVIDEVRPPRVCKHCGQ